MSDFEMMDVRELEQILRRTARTIRRMIATRGFPRPVVPGRWRRDDVSQWMDSRTFSDIAGHPNGTTSLSIDCDITSRND